MQIYSKDTFINEKIKEIAEDLNLKFTTELPTEPFLYFDETGLSFIKNSQNLNKDYSIFMP